MDALPLERTPRPLGRSAPGAFPHGFGCWRTLGADVSRARLDVQLSRADGYRVLAASRGEPLP